MRLHFQSCYTDRTRKLKPIARKNRALKGITIGEQKLKYNFIKILALKWSERGAGSRFTIITPQQQTRRGFMAQKGFHNWHTTMQRGFLLQGILCGVYFFKQLAVGLRDLSQAEKKVTVVKPEQVHKMTIIFTQKGQKLPFWVKIVFIF